MKEKQKELLCDECQNKFFSLKSVNGRIILSCAVCSSWNDITDDSGRGWSGMSDESELQEHLEWFE